MLKSKFFFFFTNFDYNKNLFSLYSYFSTLNSNGLLFANTDDHDKGNKLILNYISSHKNFICKTISSDETKAASLSPVDWKFVSNGVSEWYKFETVYEVDTSFPLPHTNNHFDTEKHIMATIDEISNNLLGSYMFFDGEPQESDITVDRHIKNGAGDSTKVKVTIFSFAVRLNFILYLIRKIMIFYI